jgi:hypothetical protein
MANDAKLVHWLLDCKGDISLRSQKDGFTSLQYAAKFGNVSVIAQLFQHGAKLDEVIKLTFYNFLFLFALYII